MFNAHAIYLILEFHTELMVVSLCMCIVYVCERERQRQWGETGRKGETGTEGERRVEGEKETQAWMSQHPFPGKPAFLEGVDSSAIWNLHGANAGGQLGSHRCAYLQR